MRLLFIILHLAILLASCNSTSNNENDIKLHDTTLIQKDTAVQIYTDTLKKIETILPEIFLFKYSECVGNCNDNERIVSKKEKGDSLFLKIGIIENCIANFRPEIKLLNDTLAIDIKIKETIFKRKNGKTDTFITENDCDCYFYFEFGIKNLKSGYKTILLDGHKIGSKPNKNIIIPDDYIGYPEKKVSLDSVNDLN